MSTTNKLLDRYLQTCTSRMDKEIAERLRVKHSAVSNWRHGRAHPDAESIEKMANAIGEPVGPWLAAIEASRARSPAARQVWLRLAATLGTLALASVELMRMSIIGDFPRRRVTNARGTIGLAA